MFNRIKSGAIINFIFKIKICMALLCITSCTSIVKNFLGNKIIDSNYNPNPQSELFFVEIPYKIEDGFITLKLKINNSELEYNFIFDTGAVSHVSERVFKELNISNTSPTERKDANGVISNGLTFKTDIKLQGLQINNIRFNTTNSDIFNKDCKYKFDGIIGSNILKQGFFYFNASSRKLIITNQKNKLPINKLQNTLKLKRKMGQPYISVKGNRNEWLLLDTGYANGSIMIGENSKLIKTNEKAIKQIHYPLIGMSSEQTKLVSYYKQKIELGNLTTLMRVLKFNDNNNQLIGSKIIQDNDVIFDVPNKKLYITSFIQNPINDSISNINFKYNNNRVTINVLTKNSTIQKKGIFVNDTVVKINNKTLEKIKDECEFDDFRLKNILNVYPLEIEIKRNNKTIMHSITKKELYE